MINVLIAEDNVVSRKMLERNVKNWGYRAILASDGNEAWKKLRKNNIQIAVLDWMMPNLSGLEICRKIRAQKRERYTYIILLTAKEAKEDIIEGLTAGADDYVTKPFNQHELQARLQTGKRIIELESALVDMKEKLQIMATRDSLTEVRNRAAILELLEEEVQRSVRDKRPMGTIMIDIDNFKTINDTHGHQAGDIVLREVSSRLKSNIRPYDRIGRYGGDELLVVLSDCTLACLEKVSGRLKACIQEKKIETANGDLEVTISMGGATTEIITKIEAAVLIAESDQALYRAKRSGRNSFIISAGSKSR